MPEVFIVVGIPGSGKSTIAKRFLQYGVVHAIHSSDAIRNELWGSEDVRPETIRVDNEQVFSLLAERVNSDLVAGRTPLIDATNLHPLDRSVYWNLASEHGVPTYAVVLDVPFAECKVRNLIRDRKVPIEVMERMHEKFLTHCSTIQLESEGWKVIVCR